MTTSPLASSDCFHTAYWQTVRDHDLIRPQQWQRWPFTLAVCVVEPPHANDALLVVQR
jgi:hypothetical protein